MRQVEIDVTDNDMTKTAEIIGSWEKLTAILGYLTTWAIGQYPKVRVIKDGDTDFMALYFDADGERRYVIGAVWHDTHYGVHS